MSDDSILYALAAHALGDFPLQTDTMAQEKFDSITVRARHVTTYTASYLPFLKVRECTTRQRAVFVVVLWSSHFCIDSRRWNDAVPIWYDQALHLISLAIAVFLTESVE